MWHQDQKLLLGTVSAYQFNSRKTPKFHRSPGQWFHGSSLTYFDFQSFRHIHSIQVQQAGWCRPIPVEDLRWAPTSNTNDPSYLRWPFSYQVAAIANISHSRGLIKNEHQASQSRTWHQRFRVIVSTEVHQLTLTRSSRHVLTVRKNQVWQARWCRSIPV